MDRNLEKPLRLLVQEVASIPFERRRSMSAWELVFLRDFTALELAQDLFLDNPDLLQAVNQRLQVGLKKHSTQFQAEEPNRGSAQWFNNLESSARALVREYQEDKLGHRSVWDIF